MDKLLVVQHTQSEYLGQIEDHLEARRIGFQYLRPFADPAWGMKTLAPSAGLMLLGGGNWGCASDPILPTLTAEVDLCRRYLSDGLPIVGFGLGADILALAAGGEAETAAFRFEVFTATRRIETALNGFMPPSFPMVQYGRDRVQLPPTATILADAPDRAAVFQIGENCFGFAGNPGVKSAIIEDLMMEAEMAALDSDLPRDSISEAAAIAGLEKVRDVQGEMAELLDPILVGLIQHTGWMSEIAG